MADNIITAVFGATRETKVRPRYRYDHGQVLIVRGVKNLPDFYEVHFSNEGSAADATPLIGMADGVTIPDSYFQSGATIYAYIYVHDEATDGTTVYKVTIPVINRARPANIEPTPEQEDIIAQAIVVLNENVGVAEDAAEQAKASAESAESAASSVEALADRAEAAAQAAEASETNASSSATTAQAAAQAAALSESNASDYMDVALDAANRANTQASRASNYSGAAQSYASQAQQSANSAASAKNDAVAAKTGAQNAATSAAASRDAAQTAANDAGVAKIAAVAAMGAAETAQAAAEAAETSAQTYAGQASQSATNAAQSAASAAQTLAQVQAEGQAQIAAIDAKGQRVIDSIPSDYTQMEEDVADLLSQMDNLYLGAEYKYPLVWTSGGFINASNGITANANYEYTADYYPVVPGAILDVNVYATGTSDVAVWFYGDDKTPLSPPIYSTGKFVTVPTGAVYMRCSNNISKIKETDAYIKGFIAPNDNYTSFQANRSSDIMGESAKSSYVSSHMLTQKYSGNLNRQKRFLAIGFDDLRDSDINMIMPLFEKYRCRATFNKVFNYSAASPLDKSRTMRVFLGNHELGDHTFLHYSFPYFDPLWNGQNPTSPDGNQVAFPSNDDFRADAGDGKNIFGKTLTVNVNIGGVSGVTWANLTDAQCQTIREYYSVMKRSDLIKILDALSNKYFGTSGTSAGSWDSASGKYTGGIYTGCATSENHEVWERINGCIAAYTKYELGINWDMYTWSRPGSDVSGLRVTYDGMTYYDTSHQYLASPQSRFVSSLTGKARSWTDVLLEYGYTDSHDYPIYGDQNYKWYSKQMFFNASMSKPNAISTPTNKSVSYSTIANAYPASYFSGTKSKAAQMYDSTGQYRTIIEQMRKNTANGMIHMEMIDSSDNYSFRVFFENVLKYCEVAGIEVITKAEAYDIAFNNIISDGNLIGNIELRNTASEFITDSTNMPTTPDGYEGSCTVSVDDNGIPVLVTSGDTDFLVYGVPYGKIKYTADVKGSGTIKFYGCKNNVNISAGYSSLVSLGTLTINSSTEYTPQTLEFTVPKAALQEYEPQYEGYGNRIMAIKIRYSTGLNVKNIGMYKQ